MQQIILQMLPGLLTSLVTALAGAVAGFALGHRKATENKDKAMESGVKALLRGQVMSLGLHYISKGVMETLRNYYDPYVALGDGDPSIKHIMANCERLPACAAGNKEE